MYGIQGLFTSLKNRTIGLLNLISSFNYVFIMKKIVYFLVFTLIAACHNRENASAPAASKQDAVGNYSVTESAIVADSVNGNMVSFAATQPSSMAKTASSADKPELSHDKKEAEKQPVAPQNNVFAMSQNTTTSRKIVRTAQVKTKVEETEKATYQIEQMARKWRGFVTANNLENRLKKQEEVLISTDSLRQIRHSEAVNTMSVRVPNQNLDTFLLEMSQIYKHLDYRHVNAKDLTAEFLTNQLKAEMRKQSSQRIATATDERGKRLDDIVNAEQTRVQMSDEAIEKKVQNVETDYDIAYSVVTIEIYQDAVVSKNIIANVSPTTASFGFRCQAAFTNGWAILLDIFVGILNLWMFILLGFLGYGLYRRVRGYGFSKLSLSRKE